MNNQQFQIPFNIAAGIAEEVKSIRSGLLAEEIPEVFVQDGIIDADLFSKTRGYFQKIVYQINTSYKNQCYDACALLTRKLVELLIEEIYEQAGRVDEIIFQESKQLFGLGQLISTLEADNHWKLNRNVEEGLNLIKNQGDKSAHNRRYNAKKSDIEKVQPYLRDIFEELLYLANILK